MGVVSPNGIGNEAFCRAVLAGTSGVKRICSFDPSELPVQIAGEVQDFDELAWVDAHERKHVSRAVPLALAASTEALRRPASRLRTVAGRATRNRRAAGLRRRSAGILRRTSPAVAARQGQAGQPVLHSQRDHGHTVQRSQHALRTARHEPRHHHRLHFVHRRVRLCAAANPVRLHAHDAGGRRGRAHRTRNHEGLHANEDHDLVVEPCAGARFASLLRRSRRIRGRRRRVDVLPGRVRTCSCARSAYPGRSRRLWLDLRGLPSRSPAGVWRGAGARHSDGHGGCGHRGGRRRLRQPARHLDAVQRPHRDPRAEAGAWAKKPSARRCRA